MALMKAAEADTRAAAIRNISGSAIQHLRQILR